MTEAAFVSECLMDGKPAIYLQTHTGNEKKRTIRNEWFRVTDSMSGTPVFSPVEKPPEGTMESVTVEGSPPWFCTVQPGSCQEPRRRQRAGYERLCRGAGRGAGRGPCL
ncbi:MAG: hypothetical protein ACLVES_08770 [Faecalibacterium prausnitzii]